jgi:branched-subunit amino acid ABC-type transport system permease component
MIPSIVDGVIASSAVVCLALAYGITYGMLGVMDLTLSARFASAAFASWWVAQTFYASKNPVFAPAVWIGAIGGATILTVLLWMAMAPLTRRAPLVVLIGSLGLVTMTEAGFQAVFGTTAKVFTGYPTETGVFFMGTTATPLQLTAAGYAILAVLLTAIVLANTGFGDKLHAIAEDPEVARCVFGLNVAKLTRQAILFTALLIGPAGMLYAVSHGATAVTGHNFGLIAFISTIVAGRRRPLAAAGIALVLTVLGTVFTRWNMAEWIAFTTVTCSVVIMAHQLIQRRKLTVRARAALYGTALVGGIVLAEALANFALRTLPEGGQSYHIPSAYQPLFPYLVIGVALLWRPKGIFADSKERMV